MAGVAGKVKVTIYLTPENVEYLRNEWGESALMERGLGGLLDAYLGKVVALLKMVKKRSGGRLNLSKKDLDEIMQVNPV